MEGLALGGLVDAHRGVVRAQAQVPHVAQQVALGVLRARCAKVGADAVERRRAQRFRPLLHGQAAQEGKAASVQHVIADGRQLRAQLGQGEVAGLQAREVAFGPGAGRVHHFFNLLFAQQVDPVLALGYLWPVPDGRAVKQRRQVGSRGRWRGVLHGTTIGRAWAYLAPLARLPRLQAPLPRQNAAPP